MDKEIKINFLHVCENAFFDSGNKLCVNGIFDSMVAEKTPTEETPLINPSFFIVINISGRILDKKKVLEIKDDENNSIFERVLELNKLEDKEKSNIVINLINISFKKKGNYRIYFKVDNKIISPDRIDQIRID